MIRYAFCLFALAATTLRSAPGQDEKAETIPASALTAAIGKAADSKEVTALAKKWKSKPTVYTISKSRSAHQWKDQGVEMHFKDNAVLVIFIYAANEKQEWTEYKGELPEGLKFSNTRADVEKKLGEPKESGGDNDTPYFASYPEKGLDIHYSSKDLKDKANKIHHIGFVAPSKK